MKRSIIIKKKQKKQSKYKTLSLIFNPIQLVAHIQIVINIIVYLIITNL